MTQYSFPGAGGRGTPAVDPGGQQRSRDGNCSSILSNNHSVPPSASLCPSEAPIGAVKPHRLNKKDSSCLAYLPLDCPVFSWLLVTEEEGRRFHTLLPSLSILERPLALFAAQQLCLQQGRKLQKHGGAPTSPDVSLRGWIRAQAWMTTEGSLGRLGWELPCISSVKVNAT